MHNASIFPYKLISFLKLILKREASVSSGKTCKRIQKSSKGLVVRESVFFCFWRNLRTSLNFPKRLLTTISLKRAALSLFLLPLKRH